MKQPEHSANVIVGIDSLGKVRNYVNCTGLQRYQYVSVT